jgi:CheY-like chemotaxis protein
LQGLSAAHRFPGPDGLTFEEGVIQSPSRLSTEQPSDTLNSQRPVSSHILVVDDERSILRLESVRLRRLGHDVTTCPRARAALQAFQSAPTGFDLLITDFQMPGMSGLELASALRDKGFERPILLMSGYRPGIPEADVRRAGIDEVLTKPVKTATLETTIGRFL